MSKQAIAYVDGSYNSYTEGYGSGVVFIDKDTGNITTHYFGGNNPYLAVMQNVAGELEAAQFAIQHALSYGYNHLTIFHDYEGISNWANQTWKAKKDATKRYRDYVATARKKIEIDFTHVKAHSKNTMNENADMLAKIGSGVLPKEAIKKLNIPDNTKQEEQNKTVTQKKFTHDVPRIDCEVQEKCKKEIVSFLQMQHPNDEAYKELKTHGIDGFSHKSEADLRAIVGLAQWKDIERELNDRKQILSAAKWYCRGLRLEEAIYKAKIDAQIHSLY